MNPSPIDSGDRAVSLSLWAAINRELKDDPLLSEYNQTGEIFISFALTKDGDLRPSSLRVNAPNPILKVRSMRALRRGIKNLSKHAPEISKEEIWFSARFRFVDRHFCRSTKRVNGHFLSFCRHAVASRPDFSRGGRVARLAVMVTQPADVLEEYKKYKEQNWRYDSGFDPFESERRDPDYHL